jgi:hypothetical protein
LEDIIRNRKTHNVWRSLVKARDWSCDYFVVN